MRLQRGWDLGEVQKNKDSVLRVLPGLSSLQYLHTFWRLYFLNNSLFYGSYAGQFWQSLRRIDFYLVDLYLKLVFDNGILCND